MASVLTGELVPVSIDYHDERGWTDQESPTSDRQRRTWKVDAGASYYRVQTIGGITKVFAPETQTNTIEIQSNAGKDPISGFPSIFYFKVAA